MQQIFIEKGQKEREKGFEIFPKKLSEVKERILQKLMKETYNDFIAKQFLLRQMARDYLLIS